MYFAGRMGRGNLQRSPSVSNIRGGAVSATEGAPRVGRKNLMRGLSVSNIRGVSATPQESPTGAPSESDTRGVTFARQESPMRAPAESEIRGVAHEEATAASGAHEEEHHQDDSLIWTRKFMGGLRRDISRMLPHYKDDWVDAFVNGNFQRTVSSTFFLFFACLSPALAFGSSYEDVTNGDMGVVEAIVSTGFSGMVFAAFAGQPLNIIGATGPKFAFITSFYALCDSMEIDFMVARLWLGLWCAFFFLLLAVFEATCLMQWATRFMEEIFALYIGVIFVVKALQDILGSFDYGNQAGFLTILMGFGSCYLIMWLKDIRTKWILTQSMRETISSFAVALAILFVCVLARIPVVQRTDISWLKVPSDIEPTSGRNWFINPFGNEGLNEEGIKRDFPVWAIFLMAPLGVGFALLNFMDQNTTALLVNRPSNALKKPPGYHLDMLVLAIIYVPCALFGIFFPAGSTVPALTHVIALTEYEDRPIPGGGTQKVAVQVAEQRVSGFMIHALVFCSLFAASLLDYIPKAVLYGVFLYMGLSSRRGNQMWDRLVLWFNFDPSTYPGLPYVTRTSTWRMHLYTLIQVVLLGAVYGLTRIKATGVAFPFFVAALVPFRMFVLPLIFTQKELDALDAHDDLPPDEESEEVDVPPAVQGKGDVEMDPAVASGGGVHATALGA